MRAVNLFELNDYRTVIRSWVEHKQKSGVDVTYSQLATAARIQNSYLSQVFAGRSDLNPDQAFLLADAMALTEAESSFFFALVERARCGEPRRALKLDRQIDEMRREHLQSAPYLKEACVPADPQSLWRYYSDPYAQVVHMMLTIPAYKRDPAKVAERLGVGPTRLEEVLRLLADHRLIERRQDKWEVTTPLMHLDPSSQLAQLHGSAFRSMAMDRRQRETDPHGYFLSTSFSATEELRKQIKVEILKLLGQAADKIKKEPAQDVFHLNIDLFRI